MQELQLSLRLKIVDFRLKITERAFQSAICSLQSQRSLTKIVWDEPPTRLTAIRRGTPYGLVAPWLAEASEGGTPGSKFAGGHRSRVTPVPIPNTEVKPATADGTAWETVWESRSLPALSRKPDVSNHIGLFLPRGSDLRSRESACGRGERAKRAEPQRAGWGPASGKKTSLPALSRSPM